MAKMQRPAWTIAFGIICALVVPGAILTHMSVAKLIPEISDLPTNLVKGFDEVFKFAYLEADSKTVQAVAASALTECGVVSAAVTCPTDPQPNPALPAQQKDINTAPAKVAIKAAFAKSLEVVNKIANDKYFGTPELKNTADGLTKITSEMDKITPTMKCFAAIPTFCGIYTSADGIVTGMAEVNKALDAFKNSDIVKRWDENKGLLSFLHAMPYFMVISLLFFGIFWWLGGVCCCCRGGTKCGTLALIPSILVWLVSFIIYAIVMVSGIAISQMSDKIDVPGLNGTPTLDLAIAHIQTNYPEFWNVVFAGMSDALGMLLIASYFFVAAALLQSLYTALECCCCPYRKKEGAEEAAAKPAETPPTDAAKTIMQPAPANAEKPAEANAEAQADAEKGEAPVVDSSV